MVNLCISGRLAVLALLLLALSGCANSYLGISVTPSEKAGVPPFETFEVRAVNLPAFLGPIVVSNFSVAMAERGLGPVSSGGEAVITLRYVQESTEGETFHDAFEERIDQGGDTRFVAKIAVEVRARDREDILWQGSIQRQHSIRPGDYMHTGRASVALLGAFRELLRDYPLTRETAE